MMERLTFSSRSAFLVGLILLATPGCFAPLDLSHRSCPCTEGWSCDPATQLCVQGASDSATPIDAHRTDDAAVDAAAMDAAHDIDTGIDAGIDAAETPDSGVDAGPHDAGHDAASSVDAAVVCTARLCDDFESSTTSRVPPWDWNVDAPARSTAQAHGGVASGHFVTPPATAVDRRNSVGISVPTTTSEVWLRYWAYVPSTSMPMNVGIAALLAAAPSNLNDTVLINEGGWSMYAEGPAAYRGEIVLTHDHWTCVAFHAVIANPGTITLTIEHQAPLVITGVDTTFPMGLGGIEAGVTFVDVSQTAAFDVFLDDVTITLDGTALACP